MQDDTWSWVGEDGVEHRGNDSELTAALSSQQLPAYTLVTRGSWLDWLPAMTVAELQWALPPQARDLVRTATPRTNEPKFPPPIHDYPALRLRLAQLYSGAGGSSRPRSSIPSSPHLELSHYATDDFDEPTVQIDADELERALHESRAEEAAIPTPRSAARAEPPSSPLAGHEQKRRALAQRLAQKMPTYPGYAVNPAPSSPSAAPPTPRGSGYPSPATQAPLTPPSIPSAPVPAAFPGMSGPVTPRQPLPTGASFPPPAVPVPEAPAFAANEPTLTSRISVLPDSVARPRRRGWLTLVALAGVLAGAAWFASRGGDPSPNVASIPLPSSSASSPATAQETVAVVPECVVDKQVQVSEFAHAQVRPMVLNLTDPTRLAIGFAQTGRIAAGVTLDPNTLNVTRLYTDNQTSPLWSVTPTLVEGELKFRASRAASTLRSTIGLPTSPPLYFGLNREGFAARGDSDVIDRLVWKSDWDTISTPDLARLPDGGLLVTMRVGGERGKIALGHLSAGGAAMGDLVLLGANTLRLDAPSLLVADGDVYVAYAAGEKPVRDRVFIAAGELPKEPQEPKPVLQIDAGVVAPTLAALNEHGLGLQYTRGAPGKQEVLLQSLSRELEPKGQPLVVSPSGRDAYEGLVVSVDETLLSLYFVRQEYGHELWATRLVCK